MQVFLEKLDCVFWSKIHPPRMRAFLLTVTAYINPDMTYDISVWRKSTRKFKEKDEKIPWQTSNNGSSVTWCDRLLARKISIQGISSSIWESTTVRMNHVWWRHHSLYYRLHHQDLSVEPQTDLQRINSIFILIIKFEKVKEKIKNYLQDNWRHFCRLMISNFLFV